MFTSIIIRARERVRNLSVKILNASRIAFSSTKRKSDGMSSDQITRDFWLKQIETCWKRRSIIWLSGVRRSGKTVLCQSIPGIEYFDCELPRVRSQLEDSESFLRDVTGKKIVLDEIHRLGNPTELLKIAADHFPSTKVIATGSSTLSASDKFQDTLTGRKEKLWLTPMLFHEGTMFGNSHLDHRLLFGGLPPFFMEKRLPERDYQEWIDSYWAKDIQELFRLEKRYSFQKFVELILAQSGSQFEATRFATPCEASRTTITNYLAVLESTHVAHVLRPFNTYRSTEIVAAPKVYGFDTGFVCYHRGWLQLRSEDKGLLWEHLVLNELQGKLQLQEIRYWRDKRGHEVDFILLPSRTTSPIAIECKWKATSFDPNGLRAFRQHYPNGANFVASPDVDRLHTRTYDDLTVTFVNLLQLIAEIEAMVERLKKNMP